ncbi:MAG TPA: arginine--tRNA ligase, partial [Dehalococcoidia bacterium]|nr:arginine--tRNA ligase [Dehalococcoidia bacterium]
MAIRDEIAELVDAAAKAAQKAGEIPAVVLPQPAVERPQRPEHGDYASNLPLQLSRAARQNPMQLAETIAKHVSGHEAIGEVSVAPPGFINIRLADAWLAEQVNNVLSLGDGFVRSSMGAGKKVQVEFVSANPTGPLHVGNGRWASIGDSLARTLAAAGYDVEKEYLVNDAGTQSQVFGDTVFARYQQLFGKDVEIPPEGYPGDYVVEVAQEIKDELGERFLDSAETPVELKRLAADKMIERIRDDLLALGVSYDVWFMESSMYEESDTYAVAMQHLRDHNAVVEKEGAVWFASSTLGEEKDNVLIRSTGQPTYFASDIA